MAGCRFRVSGVLGALASALLLSGNCAARTNFGDQSNPRTRDDTRHGSELAPFKSLEAASNIAGAWDTVLVQSGAYRETLTPMKSGKGAPLVFEAEGQVGIKGLDVVTEWTREADVWAISPWRPAPKYNSALLKDLRPAKGGFTMKVPDALCVVKGLPEGGPQFLFQVAFSGFTINLQCLLSHVLSHRRPSNLS